MAGYSPAVHAAARLLSQWLGIDVPQHRLPALATELAHLGRQSAQSAGRQSAQSAREGGGEEAALERLLARDESAWDSLIDVMTIPETYFFRHFAHFALLHELARKRRAEGRPCRVLSAGCSSGEEVWSAAAVLASTPPAHANDAVVGWDVNERRLSMAKRGRYRDWSMRAGVHGYEHCFVRADGEWEVGSALRALVSFRRVNLVGPLPGDRAFDVVLLRNVGIYWSAEIAERAALALAELVTRDGLFLVGPSDPSLPPSGAWEHVIDRGARYYRRAGSPATPTLDLSRPARGPQPPRAPLSRAAPAPPTPSPRETRPAPARDVLDDVRALADAGRSLEALALLDSLCDTSARARLWRGILMLDLDRPDDAVQVLRQCVFLEPKEVSFRRWLAHAYEAAGRATDAARESRNAEELAAR